MAEPTLSLDYADIVNAVSYKMFGNQDYTTLAAGDQTKLDDVVQAGYMQFIYPPAAEGVPQGYEWKFLRPTTTLTTIAEYDTGTVEVSGTTCTLTAGTWPSWAYTHGILVIDGTEYTVTARTDDNNLEVSAEGDVTAGEDDWSIAHNGNYDLPDDFGRFISDLEWPRATHLPSITTKVGEGKVLRLRAMSDDVGDPRVCADRIKAIGAGATGQRHEAMLYPRTVEELDLTYQYEAFVGKLLVNTYPIGLTKHAETLRLSCLARAEVDMNDEHGVHWDDFLRALAASVSRDKREGRRLLGSLSGEEYDGESQMSHRDYGLTVNSTRIW